MGGRIVVVELRISVGGPARVSAVVGQSTKGNGTTDAIRWNGNGRVEGIQEPCLLHAWGLCSWSQDEEFKYAVAAAKTAFPKWKNTPITSRQRIKFKLQELIRRDMDKLALNITTEQGKTLKDAQGDIFRGLEVVEHACGMATLQMDECVSNVLHGIDTYSIREPLSVCAGICPFNLPAMIPLWV